jgi:hypothetical protein
VESFFLQDLKEEQFEVLLIDDGSTDPSPVLIHQLADEHPNIRPIYQVNQGVAAARNHGLAEARGEWVILVDADDVLIPHRLKRLLEATHHPDLDIVRGDLVKVKSKEITDWIRNPIPSTADNGQIMTGEEAYLTLFNPNEGYTCRYLFRRDFLRQHGLQYPVGVKMMEDTVFAEKTILSARRMIALEWTFYLYRQQQSSCMYTMNQSKLCDINTVVSLLIAEYERPGRPEEIKRRQAQNLYVQLNVMLWYLTHHRSLYACRRQVIEDYHRKVTRRPGHLTLFQRLTLTALRYLPMVYLALRRAIATRKYD